MNIVEYREGEIINGLTYLQDTKPLVSPCGQRQRRAVFRCICGNIFVGTIAHIKHGNTSSCGCKRSRDSSERSKTHGMSKEPIYTVWRGILARCLRKSDKSYLRYGGRGISVCDDWVDNFMSFYDHVSKLPNYGKPGYSIDRIDNDGDYEPGNVRWTTPHIQGVNQGINCRNTSGFRGVTYSKRAKKWSSYIYVNGTRFQIGYYDTPIMASEAREKYINEKKLIEYLSQCN